MALGKKNSDSPLDHLYYINMNIHKFVSRTFTIEIDFKNVFQGIKAYNQGKLPSEKIKFSAVLMKAIALSYGHTTPEGEQPFRRLSGYFSMLPWGGSYESKTIDISLMIVRKFAGVKNQTLNHRFKAVDKMNVLDISNQLHKIQTAPEDKIPYFRFLKKLTRLPRFFLYLLFLLAKIPTIRAKVAAPTSLSILSDFPGNMHGEHISMFALGKVDKSTYKATVSWTIDHRLGFGLHFGPFISHLKQVLESAKFLVEDVK
jgi:hypothetical protein